MKEVSQLENEVQDYYGKELQSSDDLKTNACCTVVDYPQKIKQALKNVHDEVLTRYYGCGLTIPTQLHGLRVLDLGSGAGRDCYLLSQLVGKDGHVLGIDMTDEQLEVANRHIDWHRDKFSYSDSNVSFVKGNIQDLSSAGIETEDFHVIVSNCVVNLAANKKAVLQEAHRVLKDGGEFYFSDVYCDRRIPHHLVNDRELYGECLSGALYWNDFFNIAREVGFSDPRIVDSRRLTIENKSVLKKTEGYNFYSVTHRLFKIPGLEPACEDYGQAVRYIGGVEEEPLFFRLDDHHLFEKGKVVPVCGNTWSMLENTRYSDYFEFFGNFENHFGIFPGCGTEIPYHDQPTNSSETLNSKDSGCC
ncbi:MAG: methyltransferase domain-containing protein [Gammaproteobacteria bacterium]|nr:methyltransferase domain-containing protein [Gammaproteobacteria bacterium]